MAVKILENENGFDRKCFQIAQSLCGILAVVQCDGSACVGGVRRARKTMFVDDCVTSAADQATGDAPLEDC